MSSAPNATSEFSVTGSAVHDLDVVPCLPATRGTGDRGRLHAPLTGTNAQFQDPHIILLRTADGVLSTVETFLNAR